MVGSSSVFKASPVVAVRGCDGASTLEAMELHQQELLELVQLLMERQQRISRVTQLCF